MAKRVLKIADVAEPNLHRAMFPASLRRHYTMCLGTKLWAEYIVGTIEEHEDIANFEARVSGGSNRFPGWVIFRAALIGPHAKWPPLLAPPVSQAWGKSRNKTGRKKGY